RSVRRAHPPHWALVSDTRERTFRHAKYPEYKATRERMPDELVAQLPGIREVIGALNVVLLEQPGFEADDIIATLARKAEADGFEVRIVSGDKDFCQLVTPKV